MYDSDSLKAKRSVLVRPASIDSLSCVVTRQGDGEPRIAVLDIEPGTIADVT